MTPTFISDNFHNYILPLYHSVSQQTFWSNAKRLQCSDTSVIFQVFIFRKTDIGSTCKYGIGCSDKCEDDMTACDLLEYASLERLSSVSKKPINKQISQLRQFEKHIATFKATNLKPTYCLSGYSTPENTFWMAISYSYWKWKMLSFFLYSVVKKDARLFV